jgi:PKD repeat protein
VYSGQASQQYSASVNVGNVTSYTFSGLTGGMRYYFVVTAVDTSGNESPFSNEVFIDVPTTSGAQIANFTAAPTIGGSPLAVVFTDTSTGSLQSWNWTFGDGGTSTTQHPTHTYQTPGTYTVRLTVTSVNNVTDTMTKTGYVTILGTGLVEDPLVGSSEQASAGKEDQARGTIGLASVRPEKRHSADRTSSGSHSQVLTTSSELLMSAHLDIGEVDVDQSWKRVALRKPFVDPVVMAKSLSSREAEPAVVRVRHVEQTGFEISLQSWDESSRPLAPEAAGYLVIERGRFHLADGTSLESGTVDANPAYPRHSIAFSQPFRVAPVVMTTVTAVQDAIAVTSQPTHVSGQGMQLHLQSQGLSSHLDALQTVSYIAWAPSMGTLDGLVFEVNTTRVMTRGQFQTIPSHQIFATAPVFLADIQSSRGSGPINVRWDQKALDGIDVKVDDALDLEADGGTAQHGDVVGYILIR